MYEYAKHEFSRWLSTLDINQLDIYQKRLIGILIVNFEDIAAVGTAKGGRAKLLGKYIQAIDISSDEVEDLKMQSQTTDRHVQRLSSMKVENFRGFGTINEAISRRKKIRFQYTEFGPDLKEILRGNGEVYVVSPYALLWNEDYYYLIGWSDKREKVNVYRVDRLRRPEILDERAVKRPEDFNLDDYSTPIFDMFEGLERVKVELEVRNDLAKYIVDRFGTKLETKQIADDRFTVEAEVSLSPTFYAWVFQFEGGIRILKPKKAVNDIMKMVNKYIGQDE